MTAPIFHTVELMSIPAIRRAALQGRFDLLVQALSGLAEAPLPIYYDNGPWVRPAYMPLEINTHGAAAKKASIPSTPPDPTHPFPEVS